jgi:hypothetical protein
VLEGVAGARILGVAVAVDAVSQAAPEVREGMLGSGPWLAGQAKRSAPEERERTVRPEAERLGAAGSFARHILGRSRHPSREERPGSESACTNDSNQPFSWRSY